jgi:hypothetical protein
VVDDAFGRDGRADAAVDHANDLEDSIATVRTSRNAVTDAYGRRGLGRSVVHSHVPAPARFRRRGPALEHPHGPEPTVDPRRVRCFRVFHIV